MQYDIHPIFIHFPIAFLFFYSVFVVLPLEKWFPRIQWKALRIILLVVGVLGALIANSTGEIAGNLNRPDKNILNSHQWFAGATTFFYVVLLISESISCIKNFIHKKISFKTLQKLFSFIEIILTFKPLIIILAILGFFSILITGILRGIMIYGTTADPLAQLLLKLLGI